MKIKFTIVTVLLVTLLVLAFLSLNTDAQRGRRRKCPPYMCALYCEHGYIRDRKGCPTCRCKKAREYRTVTLNNDNNGAAVLKYKPKRKKCYPVYCFRACKYGYKRDRHGCKTCTCLCEKY